MHVRKNVNISHLINATNAFDGFMLADDLLIGFSNYIVANLFILCISSDC